MSQWSDGQIQRIALQPGQAGKSAQRPAQAVRRDRQHQGVEPEKGAGGQAGEDAAAVGLLPVKCAQHGGGQLRHGGKSDLADGRQARGGAQQAIADIRQQQDHHNADPAYRQHPLAEHFERALGIVAPQQPWQQHVVGNHGRQRDTRHDHHTGRRRGTANKRQQRQGRVGLGQRQADDKRIRQHRAGQQHLPGQGDRHDKQRGQGQIGRKHPLGQAKILRVDVFHYGHVELPGQADDRHHRHPGLHDHRWPVDRLLPVLLQARCQHGLVKQVFETVVQTISHERTHREEGEQLDQRFKGNGQHHAAVVFGGVEVASAEHNGEQCQHQ